MNIVPEAYRDLISDDSKALAYLSTTLKSGAPITAAVWFGVEDDHIYFVSGPTTLKVRNIMERPDVSLLIQDPVDVYRYMQIRGKYAKHTTEKSADYLNMLSRRYISKDFPAKLGGDDVIVYIKPERVNVYSWDPE